MRELFSDAISARIVDSKLAKKKFDDFRCKFYLDLGYMSTALLLES